MDRRLPTAVVVMAVIAGAVGCSRSGEPLTQVTTSSAHPSASADALTEWCNSYAAISSVLAESGTTSAGAPKALQALDRFSLLWKLAGEAEILNAEETNANLRAVLVYRKVIALLADGSTEGSPEVAAAKAAVTTTTQRDHAALQSSAGKIVGICGPPSSAPAASASG
jgi:hypothetical protein